MEKKTGLVAQGVKSIWSIMYLPHKNSENDCGHYDMTQTITIKLELLDLFTIMIVVGLAVFGKNEVRIDVALALLS